jgi:hypothetical protein
MVIVFAWMSFGFNTVLYLAGHQAIPKELYEAAEIDGARAWKVFRRITVPQLRNTTFYVLITTSILALQLFDIVWILSTPTAGRTRQRHDDPGDRALQRGVPATTTGGTPRRSPGCCSPSSSCFTFAQFRRDRDAATTGGVA